MLTEVARKYDGFYATGRGLCGEDTVFFMRIGINESFLVIGPPAVRHHREDSGLSNFVKQTLPPFFVNPKTDLDYCQPAKQDLAKKVLDHMALRWAQTRARHGYKSDAITLLRRFPGVRAFKWKYYRCLIVVALSRWYPYWVRFKCAVGPPARLFLREMGTKLRLLPGIPKVSAPEEQKRDS